jgi:3-oxoadipate CoA-transferase beta subunit
MDLAIGAKSVYVMTDLLTKQGESKLVAACTYPLTGVACVSRVYTDYAIFDVGPEGFTVTELFGDNTFEEIVSLTGLALVDGTSNKGAAR